LSEQQRKDYAAKLKAAGNKAYGSKDYTRAIDLYGQAILCKADAVFYSNRAACWNAMSNWSKVIDDTTAAITIDPEYIKALNRRANAYEQEARYSEALLDYTASCIIDQFRNDASAQAVERLLKKVAESKAKAIMEGKDKKLPSPTFVSNYLQSFRDNGLPEGLEETADLPEGSGKALLRKGLKAIKQRTGEGYTEAAESFEKSIEAGGLDKNEALAYNMRGTFRYLRGDGDSALSDLNKSLELDPALVQSYVKRASMHLEQSKCGANIFPYLSMLMIYLQLNAMRPLVTLSLPLSTTPRTPTSSTTAPSSTSFSPNSPWLPPTTKSQSTSTLNSSSLTSSSVSHNTRWALSPLPWPLSAAASRTSATRATSTTTMVSFCSTSRSTRRPLRSSRLPLRWRRRSSVRRAEE
jgi:tetratricopeptide (TPR) repeat protein